MEGFAAPSAPDRQQTATLLADGRVLVAGGMVGGFYFPDSAEVYDPLTGRWSRVAAMSMGRSAHTGTALADGRVLVTGGVGQSSWVPFEWQDSAEIFSPIGPPPRAFLPTAARTDP